MVVVCSRSSEQAALIESAKENQLVKGLPGPAAEFGEVQRPEAFGGWELLNAIAYLERFRKRRFDPVEFGGVRDSGGSSIGEREIVCDEAEHSVFEER